MSWHRSTFTKGALVAASTLGVLLATALPLKAAVQKSAAAATTFTPKLQRANELIGMNVKNLKNESLGTIKDIVLAPDSGRVSYWVLSFGGTLGFGTRYLAVPWSAVQFSTEGGKHLVLDISKDRLANAPGFPKDRWPDMAGSEWSKSVNEYYGLTKEPWLPGENGPHFWTRRLTKLIGTEVKNLRGENLGNVEDVQIDTGTGQLAYYVLSVGGFLGIGEKLCAVPWASVELLPNLRTARLDATRKSIESLAFSRNNFPDLSNLALAERTHKLFNLKPYWEELGLGGRKHESLAAWQPNSEYNKLFDTAAVGTYEGTISSVGTFVPESGAADGVRLVIVTNEGNSYTIHAGPASFVEKSNFEFNYGDHIKVTGSLVKWHGSPIVMAVDIQRGKETLRLREPTGLPLWQLQGEKVTKT